MTSNILLVDDELQDLEHLRDLLSEIAPDASVHLASSARDAKKLLDEGEIDLLFLDINLPDIKGFDMLDSLEQRNFDLVVTTRHSEYAIRAIKEGATDFLLKPIRKSELEETYARIMGKTAGPYVKDPAVMALDEQEKYLSNKMSLNHQQGIKFILLKDILYLKADNSYTTIFLVNGQKVTSSKPISRFEQSLDERCFFRIHKSYIINLYHFSEYISKDGDIAVMNNGDKMYISRYRLQRFLELLKKTTGELKI